MTHGSTSPSPWVQRFAPLVAAGAPVLDVACGNGRHVRLFLEAGHPVTAVDRDLGGLADLAGRPGLTTLSTDLEQGSHPWPRGGTTFGAVVVTNYLWRPLFPSLLAAVGDGGLLLYETFAVGNERFGKPSNPDYLLEPGELLRVVGDELSVVAYEHGEVRSPRPAVVQRICARRGGPGRLPG